MAVAMVVVAVVIGVERTTLVMIFPRAVRIGGRCGRLHHGHGRRLRILVARLLRRRLRTGVPGLRRVLARLLLLVRLPLVVGLLCVLLDQLDVLALLALLAFLAFLALL